MQLIKKAGLGKLVKLSQPSFCFMLIFSLLRHSESPIEVERRRRQLGGFTAPEVRSTWEQSQLDAKITKSTLEQQQKRQKRQADEDDNVETSLLPQVPPTEITPEQQRDRRQTTDPDQLCPTVATFVMPRAAVNNQGKTNRVEIERLDITFCF